MKVTIEDIQKIIGETVDKALADQFAEHRAKGLELLNNPQPPAAQPDEARTYPQGTELGRLVRYLASAKASGRSPLDFANEAKDNWGLKALQSSVLTSGGAMVQGGFASEIVEALRAQAVVRSLGVRTAPLINGSLTLPYADSGSTASYTGESSNITKTEPTTAQLNFTAKKLAALTPLSNDLLKDTSGRSDAFIRDDLAGAMATREDAAFIRDDGTANKPKGLRYWAADNSATHVLATAGTSVANITSDLGRARLAVRTANVPIRNAFWLMPPRAENTLMTSRDSNNNLVWWPEMSTRGTLMGYPFGVTTAIPITLGGGSESELYFVVSDGATIAESDEIEIEVFPGGAYYDGSAVQSGISRDETTVRAIARHDFGCRYRGKEVAVVSDIAW